VTEDGKGEIHESAATSMNRFKKTRIASNNEFIIVKFSLLRNENHQT
jgi:hypothetical protein